MNKAIAVFDAGLGSYAIVEAIKKALNFGGDVSISATALEDSDIFIYLAGENK